MRERLLIRHFLWRFLEHDLISPSADRHVVLSAIAGALVAVSLFMAILIAIPYQFSPDMPPGTVSLSSLDDRFLLTSASMLVMALAALAQWDALTLDARDSAVLGVLPIPRATIVGTKFMAVGLLAIGVAVAWNLAPTLLRFAAVPSRLGVNIRGALALTLAHGAATLAAGAFGFLSVLGLREVMSAILGPARFQRISAGLQAALTVAIVTALLLVPGAFASGAARNWLAQGGLWPRVLPPLWFVGLHETLAGSVIDTLPRTHPSWFPPVLAVAERDATNRYRSLWPLYHELALRGIAALIIAGTVTAAACACNIRRLPVPVVRRARDGGTGRAWRWAVTHLVVRTPLRQAGFCFTLQTLSRQASHRVALATSLAVGLSLVLITARGRVLLSGNEVSDVASIPLALLAAQSLLLASVLTGFRYVVRLPAELRASTTFRLAWGGNLTPYMSGVKLAGWMALVLPALGGLFIWHATVLGARLAALHLGVGLVVSALLMETLFVRYRLVPFASGYLASGELRTRAVASAMVLLLASFALAGIERFALTAPAGYLLLVTAMIGLSAGVRAFDRALPRSAVQADLDEPPSLPTQRLDLTS
ncbi:MAG: hypothetical protein ACRD2I_01525 [Vicinamibacterales bacterium]